MKKLFYGAALLVVAAGSFAFLPKAGFVQHAVLIVSTAHTSFGDTSPEIHLITGSDVQNIEVVKSTLPMADQIHQTTMAKLDELAVDGWVLMSTHKVSLQPNRPETTYVLTKR